jgi:hypothetical protein
MTRTISDPAAIAFARGLYRGLGFNKKIETSFHLAISEMELCGYGAEAEIPVLYRRAKLRGRTRPAA